MTDITPPNPTPVPANGFILSEGVYSKLKQLAQVVLPAVATLYFALAAIWGLPAAEQVVGTITAIDLFLGVILKISSSTYEKSDAKFQGAIEVNSTPAGMDDYVLALNPGILQQLRDTNEVTLKVDAQS